MVTSIIYQLAFEAENTKKPVYFTYMSLKRHKEMQMKALSQIIGFWRGFNLSIVYAATFSILF